MAPKVPSPSAIMSPGCWKILCTAYPAAEAPISTLVKLGEVSVVDLGSKYEACATTQYHRYPGARNAFVQRNQHLLQTTGNEATFSAGNRAGGWP